MKEMFVNADFPRKVEWPMIIVGGVVSFISGLTISEWGVIVGIMIGLAGLVMKVREHQLTIRKGNAEIDEINKRVLFMDRAGLHPKSYYQASPELEALKPEGAQEA